MAPDIKDGVRMKIDIWTEYCELNCHDQKIRQTPTHDVREYWTAVSTLLGLINSVYGNLNHWRSNQRPQIAITMTIWIGITCVRYELVAQL